MKIRIDTPIARLSADLPEDQVSDLLRIALAYATGQTSTVDVPTEIPLPTEIPQQTEVLQPAEDTEPGDPEPDIFSPGEYLKPKERSTEAGYKGFIYAKCEKCGKTKGFCTKFPIKEAVCECGHETTLKGLKPLYVKCKCGRHFKYMTNLTESIASINCVGCGSPVDLEYHEKKDVYVTIQGDE